MGGDAVALAEPLGRGSPPPLLEHGTEDARGLAQSKRQIPTGIGSRASLAREILTGSETQELGDSQILLGSEMPELGDSQILTGSEMPELGDSQILLGSEMPELGDSQILTGSETPEYCDPQILSGSGTPALPHSRRALRTTPYGRTRGPRALAGKAGKVPVHGYKKPRRPYCC